MAGALAGPQMLGPKFSIGAFLLFCRIGGCLMLAPGFSNSQIPMQIRLFVALAVTLSLTPLLIDKIPGAALGDDPILTFKLIAVELLVGGMIGILARIFFLALETLASGAAQMLGFVNPFGMQIDANEPMAPLATLHLARSGHAPLRRRPALGAPARAGGVLRRRSRRRGFQCAERAAAGRRRARRVVSPHA